ncbi:O-methyltransferase [Anaeromicropila populeti]|uniref:tRNA 5-hydroxyuridine methyltransferase n=1 Tax=Anaeromicropila populeti TaxID=37658 RepID=A0A1I6IPC2_9FIRM|nr:O-methyltransferase [Anaeromicropila populeti]SFR68574.1 Predicted O-methyltransferase YrrM [Anaeromicropila populeti]
MITNERIAAYINSLEMEQNDFLRKLEQEALADYVPIIKKPTQSLLRFLIHCHNPERILEVGTAVGFSSILMSQYLKKEAEIITIEKMPERIRRAKENIKLAQKEQVIKVLEGDAAVILQELGEKKEAFDFVFMDAAKGQYLNFLPDILKILKVGGILISDNVLQDGDIVESRYAVTRRNRTIHFRMREYLFELTHSEQFDTVVLPIGDGVTLSTKRM